MTCLVEFRVTVIRMLSEVRKAVHEQNNFNNEEIQKCAKREITKPKGTIIKLKRSVEVLNSSLDQAEEKISNSKGMEVIQSEEQKKKV